MANTSVRYLERKKSLQLPVTRCIHSACRYLSLDRTKRACAELERGFGKHLGKLDWSDLLGRATWKVACCCSVTVNMFFFSHNTEETARARVQPIHTTLY